MIQLVLVEFEGIRRRGRPDKSGFVFFLSPLDEVDVKRGWCLHPCVSFEARTGSLPVLCIHVVFRFIARRRVWRRRIVIPRPALPGDALLLITGVGLSKLVFATRGILVVLSDSLAVRGPIVLLLPSSLRALLRRLISVMASPLMLVTLVSLVASAVVPRRVVSVAMSTLVLSCQFVSDEHDPSSGHVTDRGSAVSLLAAASIPFLVGVFAVEARKFALKLIHNHLFSAECGSR